MSAKELKFYGQFDDIMVVVNGTAIAIPAEVEITIKRPAKMDGVSRAAWDLITKENASYVTCKLIAKAKNE